MKLFWKLILISLMIILNHINAQDISYKEYIYAEKDSVKLKAYVFSPNVKTIKENRPAIVIFHGGGWTMGEPSWAFGRAKHFAELGFVAIAAQYRLSNQKDITPLQAIEDAWDIIVWTRENKNMLQIDPNKLVGYGWSAGAHLVTSAAILGDTNLSINSIPNALVLVSPAVSVINDTWFKSLLPVKTEIQNLSPDENIRKGLPPTLILQGREDTVTPLSGVQNFTNQMKANGNICELVIYENVGHLFTPSSAPDDGYPNPDPKIQKDAYKRADEFLKTLGYIK